MEVKLRVVGGKNAGQEVPVTGQKFLIGRAEGCQLRAKSDQIAERHCLLELSPGQLKLSDLGSPAGTIVNGQRIAGEQLLKMGDRLKVGPLEFEVCMSVSLAAKKKPKVANAAEAAARLATSPSDDMDIDRWLSEGAEEESAPSRYAARLEDLELPSETTTPVPDGADVSRLEGQAPNKKNSPGVNPGADTRQAAADVLNKYYKK